MIQFNWHKAQKNVHLGWPINPSFFSCLSKCYRGMFNIDNICLLCYSLQGCWSNSFACNDSGECNRNGGYCEGRTTGRGVFRTHYCWCEYDEDEVEYNFGGPVGQMIGGLLLFTPVGRLLRFAAPAFAG